MPVLMCLYFRLIPAYAGVRLILLALWLIAEDNPRIRGDKDAERVDEVLERGSPPHTRG